MNNDIFKNMTRYKDIPNYPPHIQKKIRELTKQMCEELE